MIEQQETSYPVFNDHALNAAARQLERNIPARKHVGPITVEMINTARGVRSIYGRSADRVARAIGLEILRGNPAPGEKLPKEEEFIRMFGVSRTVLREAIKILDAKGFIVTKTRVGTKVRSPENWNFFDAEVLVWKIAAGLDAELLQTLREARLAVEPYAARLSASRATISDLAEMEKSITLMRDAVGDRKLFAAADLRFHRAMAASTGNFLLNSFSSVVEIALVCATLLLPLENQALRSEAVRRHSELLDAIIRRDGQAASDMMQAMIAFGGEVGELAARSRQPPRRPTPRTGQFPPAL